MLQEKLPGLYWPSLRGHTASLPPPKSKGKGNSIRSWWESGKFTLKKSMLDGRYYGPAFGWSLEYPSCHVLAYNNKGLLLAQSLLWIQAILQSRCPPMGLASPYQLMIPQPLLQGKSSMDNHTPALRDHHLEGAELMSTHISWFSQPCLNSGEQASVALRCAQKEKRARNVGK